MNYSASLIGLICQLLWRRRGKREREKRAGGRHADADVEASLGDFLFNRKGAVGFVEGQSPATKTHLRSGVKRGRSEALICLPQPEVAAGR